MQTDKNHIVCDECGIERTRGCAFGVSIPSTSAGRRPRQTRFFCKNCGNKIFKKWL